VYPVVFWEYSIVNVTAQTCDEETNHLTASGMIAMEKQVNKNPLGHTL
jgi:hypothetical protein